MKRRLSPQEPSIASPTSSLRAIGKLFGLVGPYRTRFIAALLALFVGSGMNLVFPEVARRVLDPGFFPVVLRNLHLLTAGLALLFIIQGIAFYVRSALFGIIGQQVYADLRGRLFDAVISRDVTFFDSTRSGDLASRINSDAALVQDAVSVKLSVILRYGLQVLLGVVLMAWMSWRMTAAILISVLTMVGISAVFVRRLRAASKEYQRALAHLTSFAAECFSGAKIIKALGAQRDVSSDFSAVNKDVATAGFRRVSHSASFSSGASLVLNLLLLLVQWYGIHLVVSDDLPLNDLAAFVLYGAIVAVSFSFLVSAYAELMGSVGGLDRVFELLEVHDAEAKTDPQTTIEESSRPTGDGRDIQFTNVVFSYPSRPDIPVLGHVTFQAEKGQMTALVGPSGAGKSSIVQLLLGFYSAQEGTITINGASVTSLSEDELRRTTAWVPQEPFLFGFSVLRNLTLGNPSLDRAAVEHALQSWDFLEFVTHLPEGIDTVLGEQGTQLSGGQRQRLAIARALLRQPEILILDEATSGLDSQTEEQVMKTVRHILPRATIVIISHRLSTVRDADTVYVIEKGGIVEYGTHQQLRAANGVYQQYVSRQALD